MIKKFITFFVMCLPFFMKAQYTEIINSNRPGFSESPFSVGTGIYQFETGAFFRKDQPIPIFSNPESYGVDFHFRTSFLLEHLELNLTTSLQNDKISFKNIFESYYNKIGFGKFTLAAKYLLYKPKYTDKSKEIRSWKKRHAFDWKRLIPNVGIYAGVNMGGFLTSPNKHGGITQKAGILLQHNLSYQFNVITNLYYNYIGSKLPEYSYIITATYNFGGKWSCFVEHQAVFNKFEKHNNAGIGVTYLLNDDLQINTNFRGNFRNNSVGTYASVGLSYRIDRHIDDYVETEIYDEDGKIVKPETHRKGFWNKLFNSKKDIEDTSETNENNDDIEEVEEELTKREKRRLERKERKRKEKEEKELKKEKERQDKELKKLEEELKKLEEALNTD